MGLPKGAPLAVGCSGGPDSMALTLAAAEYCAKTGSPLTAVTVDHGLRKESAQEVRQVQAWLSKRKITHVVLTWQGKKPTSNIQEAARNARYGLMADYCLTHGIHHLLVGHHLEDQAETFLLRLARGSGVDGLSAMLPVSERYGLTLLRPLLNVTKAELLAYLKEKKQKFIEDPSNRNPAYDRVRMRSAMPMLAELGLTAERLAATADNMARARAGLEAETARLWSQHCELFPQGYALLTPFNASDEITLRLLASLVMKIGGHDVRPRLDDMKRLQLALKVTPFKGVTLGGCQFVPHKQVILVLREMKAVAEPVKAQNGIWDRFTVQTSARKGWTVGALTQEGWLSFAKATGAKNPYPDKKILYSLPTLRDEKGNIQAVAFLQKTSKFSVEFDRFVGHPREGGDPSN